MNPGTRKSSSHGTAHQWQHWAKPVLFRLLAVALPLVILESSARVYWALFVFRPAAEDTIQEHQVWHGEKSDQIIPIELPLNSEIVVANTRTRTNNLGLRENDDIDIHQQPEVTRILCIGDSVTFGYTVTANEQTYPAVLERILQRNGLPCQVINAGMPRFRIQHLVNLFHERLRVLQADVVIVLGGWNDARDNVLVAVESNWRLQDWLQKNLYLVRVVQQWKIVPQVGAERREPAQISVAGLDRFQRSLQYLIDAARDSNAIPVLCTLPHSHSLNGSQASRQLLYQFYPRGTLDQLVATSNGLNQRILAAARRKNVPVIDLRDINQQSLFADAVHPTDEGSARIAEHVAEGLMAEILLSADAGSQ